MKTKSSILRALEVQRLLAEHYRPGRHDRCKLWVFRNIVYPKYRISEGTFFRYLKVSEADLTSAPAPKRKTVKQLELFGEKEVIEVIEVKEVKRVNGER
jgi:hypothetical protein